MWELSLNHHPYQKDRNPGQLVIFRKAASRFHWTWPMPCATMCGVTIKGLWKLIHILYNRKGLLLLYWTFFSILSSVTETSCTLQYPAVVVGPPEYRMRSWKRWWPPSQDYPNGNVSCAEGYCAENYTYEDFKIRVNETTSWWGSNEIVTHVKLIVKPGTIYNVPRLEITGGSATLADGQKFSEPSTWVTGRNIEVQSPRHGRTSMANDSEVTLWEDKKTPRSRFRTVSLGPRVQDPGSLWWWFRTTTFL